MQDPLFGLLAFTPKRHSIWASAIYVLCRILLRAIGLHPEAKHGYIWKWSYFGLMEFYLAFGIDWPSVIGVLDKGAPKRLSLFVKRRGESSAHCKWMPLGEMSPGLAKLSGPQHPLVSVLNFSQSKKTIRTEHRKHSKTFRAERWRQLKSYRAECRRHRKSFRVKGKG